ncbi:unnamed protein product [Victoria cruziana]
MACIKGASRSASAAFSPVSCHLAAGTMAGAVDLSFSSSASLEIFKLDFHSDEWELPVVGECASSERFNRLSWGKPGSSSEEYSLGLIAGGLVDGSINVWNPQKLIGSTDSENSLIARLQKHTGPVRGLEFNVSSPNLLASGAEDGELCIWDLSNPAEPSHFPSLKGVGSGAQGEISFLSWNHKVQHILASTSYNGTTVVWDLKRQKPVISFSDSIRRRCSVLQWNPDIATQLIVASDDDRSPSLRVWDMRNTISPMKEFVGHSKGVIAMSWCPNDSAFLLTCAKDNRTLCWDTITGEIVCELPASTNWNFDIHWYPKIPGVISASSFDGKIGVYNIEACSRLSSAESDFGGALSTSGTSAHLRAPKWLKRPVGVAFGFGGKLASFHPSSGPAGAPGNSEVYVHNLVTETSLVNRSTEFEAAIKNGDRTAVRNLCQIKSQEAQSEDERETWGFLKVMFDIEGAARTELRTYLGFPAAEGMNVNDDLSQQMEKSLSLDEKTTDKVGAEASFVGIQEMDNGEDFFNNLESPKAAPASLSEGFAVENAAIRNGEEVHHEPEGLSGGQGSSVDEVIQHALIIGDYKGAISHCFSANRMADALVIAHWGGLWESTRDQYLKRSHSSYLKVITALVGNDLMNLVNTRPLSSWRETLALLCTYAQGDEWTTLCDNLAARLMMMGNTLAATLCYICAGNIDKTVDIWSRNIRCDHYGRSYVDCLQDLMEKIVVLALATEHKQFSSSLSKLVENYAELLASQGLLTTAMEYLKLLGTTNSSHELEILRDRIAFSAEEKEGLKASHLNSVHHQQAVAYGSEQSDLNRIDSSQQYQENVQQQARGLPGSPYGEGYQQPFSASYGANYQPVDPSQQFQDYVNQPYQTAATPSQMFVPQQVQQVPQQFTPTMPTAPPMRPFSPAPPPALKNVEQYQQPSLASHLYSGNATPSFQPAVPTSISHGANASQSTPFLPNKMSSQITSAPKGFMPVTNPGFVQRPAQPSTTALVAEAQSPGMPPPSGQGAPPTVETVDTSKVSAELRPVIGTLTKLYEDTSRALGAPNAVAARKREIDDNSKRIGALFAKLNSADISPNAASKLVQLCQALDKGDISAALHIQVLLTTSDWDECNFWLSSLKRMIKMKQNVR